MFKSISDNISSGPCPYCGNSSFKFMEKDSWMFLCHDCQRYMPFSKVRNNDTVEEITVGHSADYASVLSAYCTKVSDLDPNHYCVKYCEGRKIPLDLVYYTENFSKISEYAETKVKDNNRLILPFYTKEGRLFGVQGRAFDPKSIRYITLIFDKNEKKFFGQERVDFEKEFVITEGPIDSFFLKNAIAMAGSESIPNKYSTKAILCYDNEPRNIQIVNKVKKSIDDGFKTVIWPQSLKENDINDMILAGHNVNKIVSDNTYQGMTAIIKFNEWKKIK